MYVRSAAYSFGASSRGCTPAAIGEGNALCPVLSNSHFICFAVPHLLQSRTQLKVMKYHCSRTIPGPIDVYLVNFTCILINTLFKSDMLQDISLFDAVVLNNNEDKYSYYKS